MKPKHLISAFASATLVLLGGCDTSDEPPGAWTGRVDTLESGQVVVHNPSRPLWSEADAWRVVEELRIGRVEGDGPDVFGQVLGLAVDGSSRLWVLDRHAQGIQVFDSTGAHVRSVGREGRGPGELLQATRVDPGPDGTMWVVDPGTSRVTVFDTGGTVVETKTVPGGYMIFPWPGGFDDDGFYYVPIPVAGGPALAKLDPSLAPVDTLPAPEDPVERGFFGPLVQGGGGMVANVPVPYQGTLTWGVTRRGTLLALVTDQYRLFELDPAGDTVRTFSREFDPLPVTADDVRKVREDFEQFTGLAEGIDLSRLPGTKPPTAGFFVDDRDHVWVERVTADPRLSGRIHDVFDPEGRFLGSATLPFPLGRLLRPVARRDRIYGVTTDSLGVQYVVRARVERP